MTNSDTCILKPLERVDQNGRLPRKRLIRRLKKASLFLILLVGIYAYRGPLLHGAALGLITEDPVPNADSAILHGGDRCFSETARLFEIRSIRNVVVIERWPNRLVRLQILDSEVCIARRELQNRGVPEEAIEVIQGKAKSNWEAARMVRSWLSNKPDEKIVVLCSRFGSRELRWTYSQVLDPDQMSRISWHSLPDRRYDETNWWQRKEGILAFFNSYVSFAYVWANGEQPLTWTEFDAEEWIQTQLVDKQ